MEEKRPIVITIAAITLVVLVLVSSGWSLAVNLGLMRIEVGLPGIAGRVMQFQGGNGAFPRGNFNSVPPSNAPSGAGDGIPNTNPGDRGPSNTDGSSGQSFPNFQNFQGRTGVFSGLFGILRWVTTGLYMLALVLGILCAIGLLKLKKWAGILAIILSAVLLVVNIPGLLRIFSPLLLVFNLLKVFLALAVIILLLLPAARKAYAPPKDLDLLEGLE